MIKLRAIDWEQFGIAYAETAILAAMLKSDDATERNAYLEHWIAEIRERRSNGQTRADVCGAAVRLVQRRIASGKIVWSEEENKRY